MEPDDVALKQWLAWVELLMPLRKVARRRVELRASVPQHNGTRVRGTKDARRVGKRQELCQDLWCTHWIRTSLWAYHYEGNNTAVPRLHIPFP